MNNKIKSIVWICLSLISTASLASTAVIHHRIINSTPYTLYAGVRQQFQYPIEGCSGPITIGSTLDCDGAFENGIASTFVIELIRKSAEEFKGSLPMNTLKYQNLMFTWTLKLNDKKELTVSVKSESGTPKSMTLIKVAHQEDVIQPTHSS
ncbi:MAG: hypothetical protein ACOYKA_06340 [Legionellaceae bacterium]